MKTGSGIGYQKSRVRSQLIIGVSFQPGICLRLEHINSRVLLSNFYSITYNASQRHCNLWKTVNSSVDLLSEVQLSQNGMSGLNTLHTAISAFVLSFYEDRQNRKSLDHFFHTF